MSVLLLVSNIITNITRKELYYCIIPSFFVLTVLLSSCGVKMAEGVERFAVKECYKLDKKEKMVGVDSLISEEYAPIYELGKHQMPLNRVFRNESYTTFIGLALNSKADNLYNDHSNAQDLNILKQEFDSKKYHIMFQKEDLLVYRVIYTEPVQKITVVLNFVATDAALIQSLYEDRKNFLTKKLSCDK